MIAAQEARPLLSIVVPTRNRQKCAISLARGLSCSTEHAFELVIHDNSDDDQLGRDIKALGDLRFRYIHTSDVLNMHENFTRAIEVSRGVYVCALGDDDGILVDTALRIIESLDGLDVEAVLTPIYPYVWPGVQHRLWGDMGGVLWPLKRRFQNRCRLDPVEQVESVFGDAAVTGLGMLPRVYHGLVARTALERLRERAGSYFPAGSPDLASAIGLAYTVKSMIYDPAPIIISGHSPKSGGGSGAAGRHHGRIEDQPHLPVGIADQWPPAVPRYWSGYTIYAQSAIAAAKAAAQAPLPRFAYHRLFAACFLYDGKAYRNDVIAAIRCHPDWGPVFALRIALSLIALIGLRVPAFLGNIRRYRLNRRSKPHFVDMEHLVHYLTQAQLSNQAV
jgi:hypothetical protein